MYAKNTINEYLSQSPWIGFDNIDKTLATM
jgi:hypothetical protein